MSPYYVLVTTAPAVTADWDGNSNLNVETLDKLVPDNAQGNYNSNGTYSANDALKETAKAWEKHQNNLRSKNRPEMTMGNGVGKKIIGVCDRFHIFQLEIKHMSEKCCGKSQ